MHRERRLRTAKYRPQARFGLFDLELVRLVLQGASVLDWQRLTLPRSEIPAYLTSSGLDLDEPSDVALVARIRDEAVLYLRETMSFPVPSPLRRAGLPELLTTAADESNRHRSMCACTLLKVMHVLNHFDAAEARKALAITENELFREAERRIYRIVSTMMAEGLPVVEFSGGRKMRHSMITKLLSKASPLSAQLFDRLRFRIITNTHDDLLPVIGFLGRNLFPFNYVVARESYDTLLHFDEYCDTVPRLARLKEQQQPLPMACRQSDESNRHSSRSFKIVHWIADMPLRVPNFETAFEGDGIDPVARPIVYVRTEFQILDRRSHRENEEGEAAHDAYKGRQKEAVSSRLKTGRVGAADT
ncbi:MAG: TIGR04552 family protein [Myxococcota bacterium]|jgi:uncharacterized protein (TIGR04552 family)|nr:TIGR04552 family protein [Myxococcota bacterium]